MQKRVSLKDIATRVGVSTALVSYVLNGKEKEKRVGSAMAQKIRETAEALHYTPNPIAQSLRRGTTQTIGVIVADIANPFFGHMCRVIENEANQAGYTVIFGSSDEDINKSGRLTTMLSDRQVDGFIIAPTENSSDQLRILKSHNTPVVMIDRYFQDIPASHVTLDNFRACYDATSHLIEKGFKKPGAVFYKTHLIHMQERMRGYRQAMIDAGMAPEIRIGEVRYGHTMEDTLLTVKELTKGEEACDALLFATNNLSICGLYAIRHLGLVVPDQLGVLGFDGNEAFDFFYAPLTYIVQPIEEMGKQAFQILLSSIQGSDEIVHKKLSHQLIKRASCR